MIFLYKPHSSWGFETTLYQDFGYTLGVMVSPFTWVVYYLIHKEYKNIN